MLYGPADFVAAILAAMEPIPFRLDQRPRTVAQANCEMMRERLRQGDVAPEGVEHFPGEVPGEIRKRRTRAFKRLSAEKHRRFAERHVGQTVEVLIEPARRGPPRGMDRQLPEGRPRGRGRGCAHRAGGDHRVGG